MFLGVPLIMIGVAMPTYVHPQVTNDFLTALAFVESSLNPFVEPGDGGMAVGMFQIWPIYVREANRIVGYPVFNDDDRLNYEASREMTRIVVSHYARYLEREKGYKLGPVELCSIHRRPNTKWSYRNLKDEIEQRVRTPKMKRVLAALTNTRVSAK